MCDREDVLQPTPAVLEVSNRPLTLIYHCLNQEHISNILNIKIKHCIMVSREVWAKMWSLLVYRCSREGVTEAKPASATGNESFLYSRGDKPATATTWQQPPISPPADCDALINGWILKLKELTEEYRTQIWSVSTRNLRWVLRPTFLQMLMRSIYDGLSLIYLFSQGFNVLWTMRKC